MENSKYSIFSAAVKKIEPKAQVSGEDQKTVVVIEFTEQLIEGGRFPRDFDAATEGTAPAILPLFNFPHGVLPWRSLVLQVPRVVEVSAYLGGDTPTVFQAYLRRIQATEKWDGEQFMKYRMIFDKFPEPALDGILAYYLGRKNIEEQTGKWTPSAYRFDITDLGSAVRRPTLEEVEGGNNDTENN